MMLSVAPHLAHMPLYASAEPSEDGFELHELSGIQDAVESFSKLVGRSGRAVRLYCAIPTVCPTSDTYVDLHDLHDLRNRSLVFLHNLVESLQAAGISASYRLQPSNSSLCLICALPPDLNASAVKSTALEAVHRAQIQMKGKVLLADLQDGLAFVIT